MEEIKPINSKLEGIICGSLATAPVGFALGYVGSFFTPSSIVRFLPWLNKKVEEYSPIEESTSGEVAWEKAACYSTLYSAILGQATITAMIVYDHQTSYQTGLLPAWLITNGVNALCELVLAVKNTIRKLD